MLKTIDIKGISKTTLYEEVADSLERSILKYNGDSVKLPTEFELADQFDVSRTVIRESLKILRERGLIVSKVGEGAYTTRPSSDYLHKVLVRLIKSNNLPDKDVTEVRIGLECAAIRLACFYTDDDFIKRLKKNYEMMELNKDNLNDRVRLDIEFHMMIADQSHNELLKLFVHSINEILFEYIKKRLQTRPEGNLDGLQWHKRLIDALETKIDVDEIEGMMRQHLTNSFYQI